MGRRPRWPGWSGRRGEEEAGVVGAGGEARRGGEAAMRAAVEARRRDGGVCACGVCAWGVCMAVSGRQRDKPFAVLTFFAVSLTGAHTASHFFAVRRCSTHTAKHLFAVCTHKCARQSTSFICFYF